MSFVTLLVSIGIIFVFYPWISMNIHEYRKSNQLVVIPALLIFFFFKRDKKSVKSEQLNNKEEKEETKEKEVFDVIMY